MVRKDDLKQKAVRLRKEGATYGEILQKVPVSKSTLSLWLRDVGLARKQVQKITEKRRAAQLRGGARRREMRLAESAEIFARSRKDIGMLSRRELFLIGVALYWAEGAKAKEYRPSVGIDFANSDPQMVRFFMWWLREVLALAADDILITIHLHENHRARMVEVEQFWLGVTGLSEANLTKPIIKKHNPKTKRKNVGEAYRGLVTISVRQSTRMNRRIQGWIYGIISSLK